MTGSTLLIFLLGGLIGVLMGGALCVRYLRHAVVAVAAAVLGLSAWAFLPAIAAAAATYPLTCFAVDVSGSNLVTSGGEPPSDPGPTFVRQQVVELFSQVLADLGEAAGQQVGVVTFGTGPGTRIGPLGISAPAAWSELAAELPGARYCGLTRAA